MHAALFMLTLCPVKIYILCNKNAINNNKSPNDNDKGKGNAYLYSTSSRMPLTCSDMDHIVLSANNTISAFTGKHSPGGATMHICIANT